MHVAHLSLHSFRSYDVLELGLAPGPTVIVGSNGQGKTNVVEAVDYLARLSSHRVSTDAPLVKQGAERAVVRASVVKDGREAVLEVEINPGRANRARINRSPLPRPRELVGLVRTVLFSPEDLALVKGDPADRRRFLDDLMVLRTPRLTGVRADYDRVLRQRNALLRSAGQDRRRAEHFESTLAVWDDQLVRLGAELTDVRARLVADLRPRVAQAYAAVAQDAARAEVGLDYQPSVPPGSQGGREELEGCFREELLRRRRDELQRGITLVGPHRDELATAVGTMPVKGYASHGESWSFALALRLASYELLRADGDDPVLILDDVFAELDVDRRDRLAELVVGAEQVLVTAAVEADVPVALTGTRLEVRDLLGEGIVADRAEGAQGAPGAEGQPGAKGQPGDDGPQDSPHRDTGLDLARSIARSVGSRRASAGRRGTARRRGRPTAPQASGAHPDDRDPQTLDATIGRFIAEQGWERDVRVHGVFSRWGAIVGDQVAQHATPVSFVREPPGGSGATADPGGSGSGPGGPPGDGQGGRLVVQTDSTAWATQMRLLAPTVVRRLNEELGEGTVIFIEVRGPSAPRWSHGRRAVRGGRGPRDTYG